jgi:hypothetical protein
MIISTGFALQTSQGQQTRTHGFPSVYGPATACFLLRFPSGYASCSLATLLTEVEVGRHIDWKQLLVYFTGLADQELLVRNEYLLTENRLLRQQIASRVRLLDGSRRRSPSWASDWASKR